MKAWRAPANAPAWLQLAVGVALRAPPPPPAPPAAAWGVSATLLLSPLPGTDRALYRWEAVALYGGAPLTLGQAVAAGSGAYEALDTPLPPGALRQSLAGPFGLRLNISEGDDMQVVDDLVSAYGGAPGGGGWRLAFAWSLPTCSVQVAQRPTEAVMPSECSNKGLCNRQAGACACFAGYEGEACQRSSETAIV